LEASSGQGNGLEDVARVSRLVLPSMYDDAAHLFSHKTLVKDGAYVNQAPNLHYSAISLVGLLLDSGGSLDSVIPLGSVLDEIHTAAPDAAPGVLGNLLWASSLAGDGRAERVVEMVERRLRPAQLDSATLGGLLNGLSETAKAFPALVDRVRRPAAALKDELLARFIEGADVFRGMPPRPTGFRSAVIREVSSFATQVYPLHGLAAYYAWTQETPAPALGRVASRLVEAQGDQGQWWWLYSTRRRAVLEGYPVYSVHQDGMAFMGLAPLEALGIGSYRPALDLGVAWLYGENELSRSLVESDPPIIFRNIQRKGSDADAAFGISRANYWKVALKSLAAPRGEAVDPPDAGSLEVLRECRSYHLGWALTAYHLIGGTAGRRRNA
jgi:hypothetical protein